jgi:hypothetical protein
VLGGDVTSAGQVGDGAGELAYFVVSAGAVAEFLYTLLEDSILSRVQNKFWTTYRQQKKIRSVFDAMLRTFLYLNMKSVDINHVLHISIHPLPARLEAFVLVLFRLHSRIEPFLNAVVYLLA